MMPAPSAPGTTMRVGVDELGSPGRGRGVTVEVSPLYSIVRHLPSRVVKSGRSPDTRRAKLKTLTVVDMSGDVVVDQLAVPASVGAGPQKIGAHSGGSTGSLVPSMSLLMSGGVYSIAALLGTA